MAWLVRVGAPDAPGEELVLASLEVAEGRGARRHGLLGRDGIDGALLLRPARSVHTIGMRFPIDVAFVDDDLVVRKVVTLRPNRLTLPVWSARAVIETEAGCFSRWGIAPADRLAVRGDR
jgi:uncharacterized membrane protein (UPF0127 family)